MDIDFECNNLLKHKDKLKQEIFKLQSIKSMNANNFYPMFGTDFQASHGDVNILTHPYTKLFAKQKFLQLRYQSQQKEHEQIMQGNF